jgi:hypothetical protein
MNRAAVAAEDAPSAAERAAAATYLLCACGRYWTYPTHCTCGREVPATDRLDGQS